MVEETAHLIDQVLNEIDAVLHKVDVRQIDQTTKLITKNKRIFVLGSGRSGFAAKGLCYAVNAYWLPSLCGWRNYYSFNSKK